jgi:hypothetical protein
VIESRDPASDAVVVRLDSGGEASIGSRAASKVLVAPRA